MSADKARAAGVGAGGNDRRDCRPARAVTAAEGVSRGETGTSLQLSGESVCESCVLREIASAVASSAIFVASIADFDSVPAALEMVSAALDNQVDKPCIEDVKGATGRFL